MSFSIDQVNILNAFWNEIERYITKHFNIKYITPYFLKNYFNNFITEVDNKAKGVYQSEPTIKESQMKSVPIIPNNMAKEMIDKQQKLLHKINDYTRDELIDYAKKYLHIDDDNYFKNKTIKEIKDDLLKEREDSLKDYFVNQYIVKKYDPIQQKEELKMMQGMDKKDTDNIDKLNSMTLPELKNLAKDKFGLINLNTDKKADVIRRIVNTSNELTIPEQVKIDQALNE
jgi:hypothetical protein